VEIIKRLQVILNILNCKERVNGTKFRKYAMETATMLKEKYPHKLLTPTLHKILDHGGDLIEYQSLPIGELSEEAQESKNKEYKKYRYSNTCKVSRMRQNEDLFNMLSASSDPLLSTKRFVRSYKELEEVYTKDMVDLMYLGYELEDIVEES